MIYGAVFSWNGEKIPFAELNRMISRIEYGILPEIMFPIWQKSADSRYFSGEKLSWRTGA